MNYFASLGIFMCQGRMHMDAEVTTCKSLLQLNPMHTVLHVY